MRREIFGMAEAELWQSSLASWVRLAVKYSLHHTPYISEYGSYWPEDDTVPLTLIDKAVIETALLGLILSRSEDQVLEPDECRALAESVLSLLDLGRLARLTARHPELAPSLGIVTALLQQQELPSEPLKTAVLQAFGLGSVWATERLPYRQMETDWVASILAPDNLPKLTRRSYSGSILLGDASPMQISATDLYALTHSAMFISDFGMRNPPKAYIRSGLGHLVDATCTWQLLNSNLDIAGELVMAGAYFHLPSSPHLKFAVDMLKFIWRDFGFLPSPSLRVDEMRQLSGRARTAYAFLHTYHTTYVGALAFDAQRRIFLESPRVFIPPQDVPGECVMEQAARDVDNIISKIRTLMGGGRTVAWIDEALPGSRSQEIAGVLSDTLLMTAAHTYRLDFLRDELAALTSSGLPFSPTASAAQKFLFSQENAPWCPA
jgi:hypothetical protein